MGVVIDEAQSLILLAELVDKEFQLPLRFLTFDIRSRKPEFGGYIELLTFSDLESRAAGSKYPIIGEIEVQTDREEPYYIPKQFLERGTGQKSLYHTNKLLWLRTQNYKDELFPNIQYNAVMRLPKLALTALLEYAWNEKDH